MRRLKKMEVRHYSLTLDSSVKRLVSTMENRMDIDPYQDILFGLLFLKFASHFGDHGLNMPVEILWEQLRSKVCSLYFGETVFNSLKDFEEANPVLRGAFGLNDRKKTSDRYPLTPIVEFIDSVSIDLFYSIDLFGRIYEYLHTGKGGRKYGFFLTPDSIARLLAEMLQPHQGKIYDPCCGSGGMFVHVINYAKSNNRCPGNLSFCGQESNPTLYQICWLNLALHGIDTSNIRWNTNGSLLEDAFPGLKVGFIIANPPFNQRDWGMKELKDDPRWQYGTPPTGNGNFAWLQHVISHLAPGGKALVLLPNGSVSSLTPVESCIRQKMVEAGVVECVMGLPDRLFLNTSISVCVGVLSH